MSFLKAGLFYADHITTVSPNYAREIQHEPLGMGMQGLLAHRSAVLTGILNGIDTDAWDPETDPYIAKLLQRLALAGEAREQASAPAARWRWSGTTRFPCLA